MVYFERTILKTVWEYMNSTDKSRVVVLYGMPCVGKSVLLHRIAALRGNGYILADLATDRELLDVLRKAIESSEGDAVKHALMTFYGLSAASVQSTMFLFDSAECLGGNINLLLSRKLPDRCLFATDRVDYISDETIDSAKNVNVRLFPVKPLSFSEFLEATGKGEYASVIRAGVHENKMIPRMLCEELSEQYYEYLLVGGFPQAVTQFAIEHADIPALSSMHRMIFRSILQTYLGIETENDDCVSSTRIVQIINYLKDHAEQSPPVFRPGSIRRGLTRSDFRKEIDLLIRNGFLVPIRHTAFPEEQSASIEFSIADNGLQRYLANDYDVFFGIEEEHLPFYILLNGLYVVSCCNGIEPESVSRKARCVIPMLWRQNKCMLVVDTRNSAGSNEVFDYYAQKYECERLRISDDTSRNKDADHKIMWFELDEILKPKKR